MNRRDLFKGGVAVSVVGISTSSAVAYAGNACQCEECLSIMLYSDYKAGEQVTIECVNSKCSRYEVRYKAPMVELERV